MEAFKQAGQTPQGQEWDRRVQEMQQGLHEALGDLNNEKLKISRDEAVRHICQIEEKKMQAQVRM